MSKTAITPRKLARYPELLTGPARPIHWDVDPSTACDHSCRGCPYIYEHAEEARDPMLGVLRPEVAKNKRTLLDFAHFARFVREAAEHGCKAMTFVGGGEPTMHPRFAEMMQLVHQAGIKSGVISHLGRDYKRAMFEALHRATWVRVSVNAGTRETYLRHQGKDDFDRALENMAFLASVGGPRIGMSFLVTNDNWQEIEIAARIAQEHGAAYIQYKPIIEVDLGAAYRGIEHLIAEKLARVRYPSYQHFQVIDQWSVRYEELRAHERGEFAGPCHVPRFNPKLGANGVVYTCCELAYAPEAALGSIYDEPLSAILERAAKPCAEMKSCPHCWDKPVNTLINEGRFGELLPPPESVDQEFV